MFESKKIKHLLHKNLCNSMHSNQLKGFIKSKLIFFRQFYKILQNRLCVQKFKDIIQLSLIWQTKTKFQVQIFIKSSQIYRII